MWMAESMLCWIKEGIGMLRADSEWKIDNTTRATWCFYSQTFSFGSDVTTSSVENVFQFFQVSLNIHNPFCFCNEFYFVNICLEEGYTYFDLLSSELDDWLW